jgi:MFS family permease
VVCFGAFMGQLDASIVAITFPAVQHEFSTPVAAVQWASLSYLLGLIATLPPAGRLCSHSYQAGNPGYSGSEQARPAFVVLAVVAAAAAAIALASRARPRVLTERPREGSPSGADH